jgi:transposase
VSGNSPAAQGPGDPSAGSVEGSVDPAANAFRRSFTAEYQARVIAEYEAAPHGSKAAVLRREGLYQSHIHKWIVARDRVALAAPLPAKRAHRAKGAPGGKDDPVRLRAENERLARELARAQAVVEVMGKLQGLLETISESTGTPSSSTMR